MTFQSVCVVGMGLLGGSLGLALKQRGLADRVVGVARRQESLVAARARGAIDEGSLDVRAAVATSDLVVLCVPVLSIISHLEGIAAHLPAGAIVTDVGSTKAEIVAAGERLLPGRFLGGHPMAGSEQAGIEVANANLFEGACWALTPGEASAPVEPLANLARSLGARPLVLDPNAHDSAVAATSHLPHAVAAALARTVADTADAIPEVPRLVAGSYRDTTRIAASPASLWRDVSLTNRGPLLAALAALEAHLGELRAVLEQGDAEAIEEYFARGRRGKARVEGAREGQR